jgi:hypothetical protein
LLLQGFMHRDIKPDNLVINPATGVCAVLDYGCLMRLDRSDYCLGGSYSMPTPEMTVLTNGQPLTFTEPHLRKAATHASGDVFLTGVTAMLLLFGMDPVLEIDNYDCSSSEGLAAFLQAWATYDWTPKLEQLRSSGLSDLADWLAACLAADPQLRPTPQQALAMPFLSAAADEVAAVVAAATPAWVAANQAALQLLVGVEGQPLTFLAHQHNVHGAKCSCSDCTSSSSSSTSSARCCCANWQSYECAACCAAGAAAAAGDVDEDSNSWAPGTPSIHSQQHSFSSNSSSSGCQQFAGAYSNCSGSTVRESHRQQEFQSIEGVTSSSRSMCESKAQEEVECSMANKHKLLQRAAKWLKRLSSSSKGSKASSSRRSSSECAAAADVKQDSMSLAPDTPLMQSQQHSFSGSSCCQQLTSSACSSSSSSIVCESQRQEFQGISDTNSSSSSSVCESAPQEEIEYIKAKKAKLLQRAAQWLTQLKSSSSSSSSSSSVSKASSSSSSSSEGGALMAEPTMAYVPGLCDLLRFTAGHSCWCLVGQVAYWNA